MKYTEWMVARNQSELDALLDAHGHRLRVRLVGEWNRDVRIAHRALHSLDMSGAHVRYAVNASVARINGELRACGTYIGDSLLDYPLILEDADIRGAVTLDGARIGGSLLANRARIKGKVHAIGARIGDSLELTGARIDGGVNATGAQIGGRLSVQWAHIGGSLLADDARIARNVRVLRTTIRGDLDVRRAQIEDIELFNARIGGALDATGARLGGQIICRHARIKSGIVMPTVMHGRIGQAIAQCDGYVLWRDSAGYYYAGCRGPLTHEQALAHWDRRDKRARVFSAAIARASSARRAGRNGGDDDELHRMA